MDFQNTQYQACLPPPKLRFNNPATNNYVIWRAQTRDQFRRAGVLGIIDGKIVAPLETDLHLKQRMFSLLDKGIVLTNVDRKNSRDIWLELESKYEELISCTNKGQYPYLPDYLWPTKLWLLENSSVTNFVVWRAQVRDMLKREGLLDYVVSPDTPGPERSIRLPNGTIMENPQYSVWTQVHQDLKDRLLSLLQRDVTPTDVDRKTFLDIWWEIEKRFKRLCLHSPGSVHSSKVSKYVRLLRSPSEYLMLHKAALLGHEWATEQIFQSYVGGEMLKNLRVAIPDNPPQLVFGLSIPAADEQLQFFSPCNPSTCTTSLSDQGGVFPLHLAPIFVKREVLEYLIKQIDDDATQQHTPYQVASRFALLMSAIDAGHFDIAFELAKKYPYLARLELGNKSALRSIASKKSAFGDGHADFKSLFSRFMRNMPFVGPVPRVDAGRRFVKYWFLLWLSCIALVIFLLLKLLHFLGKLPWMLLKFTGLVNGQPKERKYMVEAQDLARIIIQNVGVLSGENEDIIYEAIFLAAQSGIHAIVEMILDYSTGAALCFDSASSRYIFHVAVKCRSQKIFRLIYEKCSNRNPEGENTLLLSLDMPDVDGNNILHLAGKLSPISVLDKIPGVIFQMQHEMKWYTEIEEIVSLHCTEMLNCDGKTPKMIFIEEHKEMKENAEKWLKDTANSCTVIAALISTIMFAAAITVPGGNNSSTGLPLFSGKNIFLLFAISDAVSLITSTSSLLIFMDIMMSRYEEEDFLRHLPVKLITGTGTLLVSIMSMMMTFSTTLYLVFGRGKTWVLISVLGMAAYLIILFLYLQGSALRHLITSTYSERLVPQHLKPCPAAGNQSSEVDDEVAYLL